MRRFPGHGAWPAARCLSGISASLVAMALATGCGEDTCVVISTSAATSEWTVTLAVAGTQPMSALEADIMVEPCSAICDCHDVCGCDDDCDCGARFSSGEADLDCEPLLPATYRGSLEEDGTAHIALVADEAISAPAEILKCSYLSATEPLPSDFRVVVHTTGGSAQRRVPRPLVVVTRISPAL